MKKLILTVLIICGIIPLISSCANEKNGNVDLESNGDLELISFKTLSNDNDITTNLTSNILEVNDKSNTYSDFGQIYYASKNESKLLYNDKSKSVDKVKNKKVKALATVKNENRYSFVDLVIYLSYLDTYVVYNEGNGEYTCSTTTIFENGMWVTNITIDLNLDFDDNFYCYIDISEINFLDLASKKIKPDLSKCDSTIKKIKYGYIGYDVEKYSNIKIIDGIKYELSEDGAICSGAVDKNIKYAEIKDVEFEGYGGICSVPVTSIKESAFQDCIKLSRCNITSDVISIGDFAFNGCSNLLSISLPKSLKEIGNNVFTSNKLVEVYNLSSLNITIGSIDNGNVGHYAKVIHTSLEEESILTITDEEYAFMYYDNEYSLISYLGDETELELPNGINGYNYKIDDSAFSNCDTLKRIIISSNVTSIGNSVFYECSSLTSIEIPNSVTSIGSNAFEGCSNSVYNEYDNAYYLGNETNPYLVLVKAKSIDITSCEINENTKLILSRSFRNCRIISLNIPSNVVSIDKETFSNCENLEEIVIPKNIKNIERKTFYKCSCLKNVYYTGTPTEWSNITIINNDKGNSSLINSTIYYYSETEPLDTTNNYWHYVDGVITIW